MATKNHAQAGGMTLLPPAKDRCQICATKHESHMPHNFQSLYYGMRFKMQHGRDATLADATRTAQRARDALSDAEADYKGPNVEDAQRAVRVKLEIRKTREKDLEEAQERVRFLQGELATARIEEKAAVESQIAAESHENSLKSYRETVANLNGVAAVSADELAAARKAVDDARKAVEVGAVARNALQELSQADEHAAKAKALREVALRLREAATGTDGVLSDLVAKAGTPLRVENGRLILDTERGATYFGGPDGLSAGQRTKLAVNAALMAFPDRDGDRLPVIPLDQELYESLDPIARQEVADHAHAERVVIITAEASADEEIVAEVY